MSEALARLAPQSLPVQQFRLAPSTLGEAMEMAKLITSSELCPQAYRGKPQDAILAYEFGTALGFSWMQSLKHVAVINGVTSIFGDAIPAIIYGSGQCERFYETFEGKEFDDDYKAVLILKRKGYPDERRFEYSVRDAKIAKLWAKQTRNGGDTPWVTNPKRMLRFRCLGFGARDVFADKLSGLILAEEAMDYPDAIHGTVVASEIVPPVAPATSALERLPEPLRDQIGKAFETLSLSPALRTQKLTEFLGGESERSGQTLEDGAVSLLEWCRAEFAHRQGREHKPGPKGSGNGKKEEPKAPPASVAGGATGQSVAEPRSDAPADKDSRGNQSAGGASTQAPPVTASEIPFAKQDLGF